VFEREIARAARSHQPVSVFMIDIDHFKRFDVCDVNMPRMNGLEILVRMKGQATAPALPVLMLTTEAQPSLIDKGSVAASAGVRRRQPVLRLRARTAAFIRVTDDGSPGSSDARARGTSCVSLFLHSR
jgi:CheY-like chemotaxis protein